MLKVLITRPILFPLFPHAVLHPWRLLRLQSIHFPLQRGCFVVSSFTEVVPLSFLPFRFRPQAPVSCSTMSSSGSLVPTPGPKRPSDPHGVGLLFHIVYSILHLPCSMHSIIAAVVFAGYALSAQRLGYELGCCFSSFSFSRGMPLSLLQRSTVAKSAKHRLFLGQHT